MEKNPCIERLDRQPTRDVVDARQPSTCDGRFVSRGRRVEIDFEQAACRDLPRHEIDERIVRGAYGRNAVFA